jgi:hypothetical protein
MKLAWVALRTPAGTTVPAKAEKTGSAPIANGVLMLVAA